MNINIGTKLLLRTEYGKSIGIVSSIESDDKFKYFYGYLIGKDKNCTFEIINADRGVICWNAKLSKRYGHNASFIESIEIQE